jgi:hypothetical protein
VATSTTKLEYISLLEASKQGQWIRALLRELQRAQYLDTNLLAPIFSDNQGYIALTRDLVAHSHTKHIDVRYYYIRELVAFNKVIIEYIPTKEIVANMLTKPLSLTGLRRYIGGLFAL